MALEYSDIFLSEKVSCQMSTSIINFGGYTRASE